MPEARPLIDRFYDAIDPQPNGCWLWTRTKDRHGYGVITIGSMRDGTRRQEIASRLAWQLLCGEIPEGLFVLHNCPGGDNPACCNPEHLWLGTNTDNMRDKVEKRRHARGETHGAAKLTTEQVRTIRERMAGGASNRRLAREHGVSVASISHIRTGRRWACLEAA